jgi:hypothetical protein
MTSLRSSPAHRHHPSEAAMKNSKQIHSLSSWSTSTSTRAARMAAFTRVAVLALEAALAFAMYRAVSDSFESEKDQYIAAAGVPPPLWTRAGAAVRTKEGPAWS